MYKRPFLLSLAMAVLLSACATAPKAANADTSPATESAAPKVAAEIIKISTNGKYAYYVNDVENPELTLKRGQTYQIEVEALGHPLWIKTKDSNTTDNAYTNGVTNNGTYKGIITFKVPKDAPASLFYNCQYHINMHGKINITD